MQIFLIAAMTADGYIAENDADVSTRWTSEADSQWFRERTKQAGVMIMGRKTYETIARTTGFNCGLGSSGLRGSGDLRWRQHLWRIFGGGRSGPVVPFH